MNKEKATRILMSMGGVIICAVSVAVFKIAALGVDPFQSLMAGLDRLIPIPFGTLYMLVNLALLSFCLIFDRSKMGAATFINMFLLGYVTEFSLAFLQSVMPAPSMLARTVCFLIGIVVICFGSSLYMTANCGVSTYDAVALVLAEKWKVAPFQYCRIATDLVCVAGGVALYLIAGGKVTSIPTIAGVGTIITAFFMGPLIELFNVRIARPLLEKL